MSTIRIALSKVLRRSLMAAATLPLGVGLAGAADVGKPSSVAAAEKPSGLTRSEEISGWETLLDGDDLSQWRNYNGTGVSDGWTVKEGVLTSSKGAGDLVTQQKYDEFELQLEYRLTPGANSGVMFHVVESDEPSWHSGPEIQLYDSTGRENAQKSGWLYQLFQPRPPKWADQNAKPVDSERPVGQWNQLYLRVSKAQSEVCLNGLNYYRFRKGNDEWNRKVASSKFAKFPQFGKAETGYIALQDHGSEVSFRNIKVRQLPSASAVASGQAKGLRQPIDGKLDLTTALAFPKLQWADWEPIDDAGNIRALRFMELTSSRDGTNRLFAVAQKGIIYVFENRPDVTDSEVFLDISDKVCKWFGRGNNEQGLLGLAFDPDYASNGHCYVYYSDVNSNASVLSRFTVSSDDANTADPDSELEILRIEQPFKNHNGGSIEFGPDGYLYIGMGDGGDRNDPYSAGQDLTTLLGSILRIDVSQSSSTQPYQVPADNPFASPEDAAKGYRGEIFAYGVRNIWRLGFDRTTGKLWAGDVGQELIEEVNLIRRGGNYGWSVREGSSAFGNQSAETPASPVEPVWAYDHQIGKSITGGRVCRSQRLPELYGRYLYADYVSGKVWALTMDDSGEQVARNEEIVSGGIPVLSFGEDDAGEIYFMNASAKGECIYKFVRPE
ncbi:MAG: family 16 glycoside hydrolase [Planctomycetota bacterium]